MGGASVRSLLLVDFGSVADAQRDQNELVINDLDDDSVPNLTRGLIRLQLKLLAVIVRGVLCFWAGRVRGDELRHTVASLAVSVGANVKAGQRMLGHASAAMTLDVYADSNSPELFTARHRHSHEPRVRLYVSSSTMPTRPMGVKWSIQ